MNNRIYSCLKIFVFACAAFFVPAKSAFAVIPVAVVWAVNLAMGGALVYYSYEDYKQMKLDWAANDPMWWAGNSLVRDAYNVFAVGEVVSVEEGKEKREYEIPLASDVTIKPAALSSNFASPSSPVDLRSVNWKVKVVAVNPGYGTVTVIDPNKSLDGQKHVIPIGTYESMSDLENRLNDMYLQFSKHYSGFRFDYDNVVIRSFLQDGRAYWYFSPDCLILDRTYSEWVSLSSTDLGIIPLAVEPKDGSKRFMYKNGGLVADPTDPDFTEEELSRFSSPSRLSFQGVDAAGRPTRFDVSVDDDKATFSSATEVSADEVAYRSGDIKNKSISSFTERVFQGTNFPTLFDSMPDLLPGSDYSPSSGSIEFPSDYAKEGEAMNAANRVTQSLDVISNKLDTLTDSSDLTDKNLESPPDSNFGDSFFKETFDPLLGWELPSHQSVCPVANFALFNQNYVMDAHCLIAENNRAALSSIMMVAWVLVALFIVLRA